MKKRIYVLLMIVSIVAVLMAGCGKDDKKTTDEKENKETQAPAEKNQDDDKENLDDNLDGDLDKEVTDDITLTDTSDLAIKYRGQTVEEFVMSGAEILGYSGVGGYYDFMGVNEEKGELYTFTLSGDGLKEKLDNKEFTDEYEDVIGEFEIDSIEVLLAKDPALEKYVGLTIEEFEKVGFDITGFDKLGELVLKSQTKSGHTISITLEGDANAKYETIEEPFDADMGAEFAEYVIKTVEFSVY